MSWNVAGISKARGADDYIRKFDIVLLQETWVEREKEKVWIKKLNKDFNWTAKAAERTKTRGRAKGGVMVGIKKKKILNMD